MLREVLALCLLLFAVAYMFGGVVSGAGHLWGDFVSWYFPSHEYIAACLREGRWPLWNPFMDGGMPFLGEADHGMFYPLSLLLQPVSRHRPILFRMLEFYTLAHVAWAAISMYLFARSLRLARWPAIVAGLAFGLSGSFWARSAHLSLLTAQAWAPCAIGGAYHAARGQRFGLPLATLALALIGFSGSPASLVVIAAGLVVVVFMASLAATDAPPARRLLRALLVSVGVGVTAALLSGAQLVPMLEWVGLSERSAYSYAEITEYSATPASLVMLLAPRFYGWLDYEHLSYWGPNNFAELSGYAGVLPILLLPVALRQRPWRDTAPWLALAGGGLWLALGKYGGLHYLMYRLVPLVGSMRAPGRYLLIWAFGMSMLAALGLDAALRARAESGVAWRDQRRRLLLGGGVALGLAALLFPAQWSLLEPWKQPVFVQGMRLSARSWVASLAAIATLARTGAAAALAGPAAALALATDLTGQGRSVGILYDNRAVEDLMHRNDYETLLAEDKSLFRVRNPFEPPSRLMLARLQSDSGPGRHLLDYELYRGRTASHFSPLLDLLNVKYLAELENEVVEDRTPNLVVHEYVWLRNAQEAALPVRPAVLCNAVDIVSNVGTVPATRRGDPIADLVLVGETGETRTLPLRLGFETGDVVGGEPIVSGREIVPSYYINVTDSATLTRKHYLTHLEFPPLAVKEVRLRHAGGEAELWMKELYLRPAPGAASSWKRIYTEPSVNDTHLHLYQNLDVMPRAFLVARASAVRTLAEALERITGEGFDPRREAVIESSAPPRSGQAELAGDVKVLSYSAESIEVEASVAAGGAWLVLSEMVYPGWNCRVDGAPTKVERADGLFRAVWLEAGAHRVSWQYEPESLRTGIRLTGVGGLILVAMVAAAAVRGGHGKAPEAA